MKTDAIHRHTDKVLTRHCVISLLDVEADHAPHHHKMDKTGKQNYLCYDTEIGHDQK